MKEISNSIRKIIDKKKAAEKWESLITLIVGGVGKNIGGNLASIGMPQCIVFSDIWKSL